MMDFLINYSNPILTGIVVTLLSWLITGFLSLCMGVFLGLLSSKYGVSNHVRKLIRAYAFVAKGIPAYVQILIAYFILPALLGIKIPGFVAACGALAFCSSGYITEIIRSGINAIPQGQWDASLTLGYSFYNRIKRIILPQAFKNIAPALIGEFEQLLKSTSLFATIGITELTRAGMNIISRDLNPIPVYLFIAITYLLFSAAINVCLLIFEKKGLSYAKN